MNDKSYKKALKMAGFVRPGKYLEGDLRQVFKQQFGDGFDSNAWHYVRVMSRWTKTKRSKGGWYVTVE